MAKPTSGAVLVIAGLQLCCGLVLLGLYEGYKRYYYSQFMAQVSESCQAVSFHWL